MVITRNCEKETAIPQPRASTNSFRASFSQNAKFPVLDSSSDPTHFFPLGSTHDFHGDTLISGKPSLAYRNNRKIHCSHFLGGAAAIKEMKTSRPNWLLAVFLASNVFAQES